MSEDISLPLFDEEDIRLVGWESGKVDDGDWVIQFRCQCGCGRAGYLKLPPGAYISHALDGKVVMDNVTIGGPIKEAPRRE